jgi:hypothetical protein
MSSIIRATTTSGLQIAPDNSGSLQLQTNGTTTAVTIDTSQNVGIGTTSPTNKLTIGGTNSNIFFKNADATTGYAAGQIANTGGNFYFGLTSSTGAFWQNTAGNYAATIGTSNATNLSFATNDNVRMVIDSSGNVSIGSTAGGADERLWVQTTNADWCVQTNSTGSGTFYHISFRTNGTQVGSITSSSTTTSYTTTSDYRLKENIVPMTGALDKVLQLKPVTYTWKSDGSDGQGFIAHELQEVIPDAVSGEKDAVNEDDSIDPQGIDTSFLVATLTAAIQEQQTIINDLKARIETLEAK